jgi:hypothetical protein
VRARPPPPSHARRTKSSKSLSRAGSSRAIGRVSLRVFVVLHVVPIDEWSFVDAAEQGEDGLCEDLLVRNPNHRVPDEDEGEGEGEDEDDPERTSNGTEEQPLRKGDLSSLNPID